MSLKALSLGAALGFLVAMIPSCGTPSGSCGANNCTGCCNAGMCVAAEKLTDSACGSAGNACSNCASSNQTCNLSTKSCIGASTGGGSSGTGGGTSGTGGGTTGGGSSGTGGGNTAGSGTGGGSSSMLQACDFATNPTCPPGSECLLNGVSGSAGTCVPGNCSVANQDCTAPNTKCMVGPAPDGGVYRLCLPFTLGDGGLPESAACTPAQADPCQKGSQCISSGGAGSCRRYCHPLTAPCSMGSECNVLLTFGLQSGPTLESHLLCTPVVACNPYTQAPCQAMEGCMVLSANGGQCVPAGSGANGAACSGSALCQRGLQCVASGAGGNMGVCRNFCNVDGGMPTCAAGQCSSLMNTGIGVCSM